MFEREKKASIDTTSKSLKSRSDLDIVLNDRIRKKNEISLKTFSLICS